MSRRIPDAVLRPTERLDVPGCAEGWHLPNPSVACGPQW